MLIFHGRARHGYVSTVQERTLEEHRKLVEGILKRDKKRRKRIEAAGIEYECPEIVRSHSILIYIHAIGYSEKYNW